MEGLKDHLWHENEFKIRQFWHTESEIKEDVAYQKEKNKVQQLFKNQANFRPIVKYTYKAEEYMGLKPYQTDDNAMFYQSLEIYFLKKAQTMENKPWEITQSFERLPTCCPFLFGGPSKKDSIDVEVWAQMSKPIYYNDEKISLDIHIDNLRSAGTIFKIEVSLRKVFLIKRKLDYVNKNNVEEYVDLEVYQFGDLAKGK